MIQPTEKQFTGEAGDWREAAMVDSVQKNKGNLDNTLPLIQRAMRQSDDLVVVFDYCDCHGMVTRRVVSPIRLLGRDHLLGLCLSREAPRQFCLSRIRNLKIGLAANFVMPVPLNN